MQNSTKQDVTGPTRSFSDPLLRYSWSNSKDLAKNLELDNEPSTGNLRGWLTVFMLLIAMTISSALSTGCTSYNAYKDPNILWPVTWQVDDHRRKKEIREASVSRAFSDHDEFTGTQAFACTIRTR